eukprot:tig00021234_g19407.t1
MARALTIPEQQRIGLEALSAVYRAFLQLFHDGAEAAERKTVLTSLRRQLNVNADSWEDMQVQILSAHQNSAAKKVDKVGPKSGRKRPAPGMPAEGYVDAAMYNDTTKRSRMDSMAQPRPSRKTGPGAYAPGAPGKLASNCPHTDMPERDYGLCEVCYEKVYGWTPGGADPAAAPAPAPPPRPPPRASSLSSTYDYDAGALEGATPASAAGLRQRGRPGKKGKGGKNNLKKGGVKTPLAPAVRPRKAGPGEVYDPNNPYAAPAPSYAAEAAAEDDEEIEVPQQVMDDPEIADLVNPLDDGEDDEDDGEDDDGDEEGAQPTAPPAPSGGASGAGASSSGGAAGASGGAGAAGPAAAGAPPASSSSSASAHPHPHPVPGAVYVPPEERVQAQQDDGGEGEGEDDDDEDDGGAGEGEGEGDTAAQQQQQQQQQQQRAAAAPPSMSGDEHNVEVGGDDDEDDDDDDDPPAGGPTH